jgi:hypothetical protein
MQQQDFGPKEVVVAGRRPGRGAPGGARRAGGPRRGAVSLAPVQAAGRVRTPPKSPCPLWEPVRSPDTSTVLQPPRLCGRRIPRGRPLRDTMLFRALRLLPLSLLLLLHSPPAALAQGAPAYCPVSQLQTCKGSLEKCQPSIWHGIDSLELFELQPLNHSAVLVRSLNGSFTDTIATITVLPKTAIGGRGGGGSGSSMGVRADPNPLNCVLAPPISTKYGNCTTTMSAYFSDVGTTLTSAVMDSCGIIEWVNGHGLYGAWVHANLPQPSPSAQMCVFNSSVGIYHEIGSEAPDGRYFTLQTGDSPSEVHVHSLNNSFPPTTATVAEFDGKIAMRARLFGNKL